MALPPDYHMHTPLCHHAEGEPTEYAAQAVRIGLTEIGFTEHAPMPGDDFDDWRMLERDMDRYIEKIDLAAVENPEVTIRKSLEIDYVPGYEEWIYDLAKRYEWDYLIGSVHYLGVKWSFDHPDKRDSWEGRDVDAAWAEYFETLTRSVALGVFDIIGHCDLIKVFGHRPSGDCSAMWRPFLEEVKRQDAAIEINTNGLNKPCGEMFPAPALLELAAGIGVGLTFASDAHRPGRVGDQFDQAVALAKRCGFTRYRHFAGGQYESVPF
ncbi:MAG: histidinol-phosphatase HisJ family protein [Verrucomicrobiota bacterium]|nr:histidinol-phosphatase HisJ family protein [Verrucomicrobiota bacterium]